MAFCDIWSDNLENSFFRVEGFLSLILQVEWMSVRPIIVNTMESLWWTCQHICMDSLTDCQPDYMALAIDLAVA